MTKLKPYTKYKDSGLNWLGDIPDEWSLTPIRSLFRNKSDKGHPEEKLLSVYREYGVIEKDSRDDNHNVAGQDLSNYKLVKKNDLVVNKMKTWQGSLGISKFQGIVSPAYITASSISDDVDPDYANYLLRIKNYVFEYNRLSYGVRVGQWDMHFEDFKKIPVLLPPKATQTQISKYLDNKIKDINKYVKKLKKEIALLKEHRKKIISQAVTCGLDKNRKLRNKPEWSEGDPVPKGWKDSGVEWLGLIPEGWEIRKLKYVTNKIIDGTHFTPQYVDEGVPFLRVTDINNHQIDLEKTERITIDEHIQLNKRCNPERGDLLLSKNGTIGLTKVIDWDWEFSIFVSLCLIKFKSQISPYFFRYIFESNSVEEQLFGHSKKTSIYNLHLDKIKELLILYPSIQEQNQLNKYLDQRVEDIETEISKIQEQINFIKEYKQSLISKVVTGKIDVRNINNNLSED